jgi:conserved hypothetical protein TIGR02594
MTRRKQTKAKRKQTKAKRRETKASGNKLFVIADLNVRKVPSFQGEIKGVLKQGDVVQWLGSSDDDYWRKIKKGVLTGWSSHKYLLPSLRGTRALGDRPWLPIAYGELGVKEIGGKGANSRIVEYLHSTNLGARDANTDETWWCSAFVNWCVKKAGRAGTDDAAALSWASWGKEATAPVPGDIVVFDRGGGHGHVGFFVSATATTVKLLGGNQDDEVEIKDWLRKDVYTIRKPA